MGISYERALELVKWGDDARFDAWPKGDFIRWCEGEPTAPAGYAVKPYVPTHTESSEAKWRRA